MIANFILTKSVTETSTMKILTKGQKINVIVVKIIKLMETSVELKREFDNAV